MSVGEKKRIGKIHERDAPLDSVVAAEMARIQKAFDQRVVDHTEELVQKVQKGEPISNKAAAQDSPAKKK